jgi:hypothetical protein
VLGVPVCVGPLDEDDALVELGHTEVVIVVNGEDATIAAPGTHWA